MSQTDLYKTLDQHSGFAMKYFAFQFNKIPSILHFKSKMESEVLKNFLLQIYPEANMILQSEADLKNNSHWEKDVDSIFCVLKTGLLFQFEHNMINLYFDETINKKELEVLENGLLKLAIEANSAKRFSMIKKSPYGEFELADFKTKDIDVNIDKNYNDDLVEHHTELVEFLNRSEDNGIVLFHGMPGTGKTSYIRSLIKTCTSKFIYVPNSLFEHLSDPDFISFIGEFPESVIILEDCENLIKIRDHNQSGSGISNLLNLGDGLLGDALKLKIICTFNCELAKVDEALLRKGRLSYRYEFGPLEIDKANQLFKSLGMDATTTIPMTLSDVFNYNHNNNSEAKSRKQIGF